MRSMRAGQWVAFDASTEKPHKCGKKNKEDPNIKELAKKYFNSENAKLEWTLTILTTLTSWPVPALWGCLPALWGWPAELIMESCPGEPNYSFSSQLQGVSSLETWHMRELLHGASHCS